MSRRDPGEDALPFAETRISHNPPTPSVTSFEPETITIAERRADLPLRVEHELNVEISLAERYEPGPLLGRGGMGDVTLQVDRRIGRPIAKKTLRTDRTSSDARARFIREGRVQGQLEHPSIVPVYDLGTEGDARVFFTMKRIRGQTLSQIIERLAAGDPEYVARFTRRKLLAAFIQVCLAIEYAHARGVVHRDLKPSNLMLGDFGEVYVLDWGIAKVGEESPIAHQGAPAEASGEFTADGEVLGTPQYMAPEQLNHDAPVDARADVFTLGIILFELLTLESYRDGGSLPRIIAQASREDVERPSSRRGDVPPELDEICARALEPRHATRTPSAVALAESVERYLEGDRDLVARRAQAAQLLASAKRQLEGDVEGRVRAMREALQALALVPDDSDAQRLLLSLVVDGTGALPESAEREFAEGDVRLRTRGAGYGVAGYCSWLLSLPLAMWAGVREWSLPITLTVLTLVCIVYAFHQNRVGARSMAHSLTLAVLSATVVAVSSCWLGPFVLAPVAACATAVMFVMHCTKRERPWLLAIWSIAALAPFAFEQLSLGPPAFSFRGDELVLHARSLGIPRGPTLTALAYTSVTFLLLLGVFIGRLRDQQREAERHLFVQAWHLRQLFPAEPSVNAITR